MNQQNFYSSAIHTFQTPEEAAAALADKIIDQTKKTIDEKGKSVWAVSGGSSILKLYDALLNHREFFDRFGKSLSVIWVDERVVSYTDPKSNFGSAKKYFWKKFEEIQLIPVPFKMNAEQSANAFKSALEENKIRRGDIDVMILGMGSDGHTASLFPGNKKLNEEERDIVPVSDPSVEVDRVSMTYPFINSSPHIYLYFYGDEKGKTMGNALRSENKKEYPILGIDWKKTKVYTDQALQGI